MIKLWIWQPYRTIFTTLKRPQSDPKKMVSLAFHSNTKNSTKTMKNEIMWLIPLSMLTRHQSVSLHVRVKLSGVYHWNEISFVFCYHISHILVDEKYVRNNLANNNHPIFHVPIPKTHWKSHKKFTETLDPTSSELVGVVILISFSPLLLFMSHQFQAGTRKRKQQTRVQ